MTHRTETQLVRACLDYLAARGIYAWRNSTGATKIGERFLRFGKVGSADILALIPPTGRLAAIECKNGRGKTTPAQEAFLEAIRANGGLAVVVRSVDDLHDVIGDVK